jgi:hypothetical protein
MSLSEFLVRFSVVAKFKFRAKPLAVALGFICICHVMRPLECKINSCILKIYDDESFSTVRSLCATHLCHSRISPLATMNEEDLNSFRQLVCNMITTLGMPPIDGDELDEFTFRTGHASKL